MTDRVDLMIQGKAGRLSVRAKGLAAKPAQVVIFVQGANLSGQAGFDFGFEGGKDYSMMDAMVARGLGAVTFSVRGYAASDAPPDLFTVDTDAAIEDLVSVVDWVAAQGYARPHIAGWSWGGRIVARYAEQYPERIARLGLLDPALGGNTTGEAPTEQWWSGGWDWWYNSRLVTEYAEPAARKALADFVAQHEPRSPAGIRMENSRGTIAADPARITCPTLLLYGSDAARQAYMKGGITRAEYFERLATGDKAFVIIPACGDYAHLEIPRRRFQQEVADFLLQR
jgi:pimeloyl-ACP methyl ester carboxylesterase